MLALSGHGAMVPVIPKPMPWHQRLDNRRSPLGARHALSVSLGVQKGVREKNGMFFKRNPEFVVGRVVPDFSVSLQFVKIPCSTRVPWAGGSAAIMEGACDPGGHPLRFAPKSPHHEGATHI